MRQPRRCLPFCPLARAARAGAVLLAALLAPAGLAAASLPQGFAETRVAGGLSSPTAMAFAPDGRLFVCEQWGRLRVVKDGVLLATPFLSVTVSATGERGLLGVTFDPAFATNGYVYVYYTATSPNIHNRVSRFTAQGDVAVPGSERVILELDPLSDATNHNGGALHFGRDGKLYVAVGENARPSSAQSLDNRLGKILRVDKDGSIPTDNPFYASASGANRAIWALGLRNPFTFAFRPGTGRMFINDVGERTWEEIDEGAAGANYGWPLTEGRTSDPRFRSPIHAYDHGLGCAITGGVFYDPPTGQFPAAYTGNYFFADYCRGWIRRFDPASGGVAGFAAGIVAPVDLRVGSDGSLYYLSRGAGAVYRVRYTASQAPTITTQPADVTVPVGAPASFGVTASGTAPLSYQWHRDGVAIPGATSRTLSLQATTLADDGASFRARVSNAHGQATSDPATLTVSQNTAPRAAVTAPVHRQLYSAGDTVSFAGTATDLEDGVLPASAFTWRVDFHHDAHTHPFVPERTGVRSGSFTIPTSGETSANVWYRVVLTVRDSGGLADTTYADVVPRTSRIALATIPAGLRVTLDGQPADSGTSVASVEGMTRTLGVVSPQTVAGTTYEFESWSDGGSASHTIRTPASDVTYTARYRIRTHAPGVGLVGTYYDGLEFSGTQVARIDPMVSFDWAGVPAAGIGADTFSVRWTGQVRAGVTGVHTFHLRSDGARLWVNGRLLVDRWADHAVAEDTGTIELAAGTKYPIRVEYQDRQGPAVAQLSWSAPGLPKQRVPTARLHPPALLVTGSLALTTAEAATKLRVEGLGYAAVVRPASALQAADAAGRALVVISSTAGAAAAGGALRHARTPVLTWNPASFGHLGMTSSLSGSGFGTASGQTQLSIANPAHPLAAGLTGSVTVCPAGGTFAWGRPAATGAMVARLPGSGPPAIFAYEKGVAMAGLIAPGRRVGFFPAGGTASALSSSGWRLFDAAVRWASGP
jgi:glucose/arabinose dehydrogenase